MATRKKISASLRWQVFARDNFTCRYCGVQAGKDGVEIHADHIISVADGGDDSIDNLLTACQQCNGGKGARSLSQVPDAEGVADRMRARADSIRKQADSISVSLQQEKRLEQEAVNLKCQAYGVEQVQLDRGEKGKIVVLCREFGAETVLDWYRIAVSNGIPEWKAIRYVSGIARNVREQAGGANA